MVSMRIGGVDDSAWGYSSTDRFNGSRMIYTLKTADGWEVVRGVEHIDWIILEMLKLV